MAWPQTLIISFFFLDLVRFAEVLFPYVETPFFVLNSAIDWWQLSNEFFYDSDIGNDCVDYPTTQCNVDTVAGIQDFNKNFLGSLSALTEQQHENGKHGAFIDVCMNHAQMTNNKLVYLPRVKNVSMAEQWRMWYQEESKDASDLILVDEKNWPYRGQQCDWGPTYSSFTEENAFLLSSESFLEVEAELMNLRSSVLDMRDEDAD